MTFGKIALAAAVTLGLAACGSTTEDRAASGAGIGAASGAAIGAVFGGIGAIPGALIGAAVGGGTGAVTNERQVDLGDPVWR
jgi:osmotically inducible lipoprotein OsmB